MDDNNKSEYVRIWLSKDKLLAFLWISDAVGAIGVEDIAEYIIDHNISHGLDHQLLDRIVDDRLFNQDHIIAQGTPAVDGKDTEIRFFFNTTKFEERPAIVKDDGTIDHYNKGKIDYINSGVLLAKVNMFTHGSSGLTVNSDMIQAQPGNHITITAGDNVVISNDGLEYRSSVSGHPRLFGSQLSVAPTFEVNDVDIATGNLDFDGNILIRGNVRTGFKAFSGRDITIFGCIHHADVIAEGAIDVKGGKIAGEYGFIKSGSDIKMNFLEGGTVEAKGNVLIDKAIVNCNVKAGDSIFCDKDEGLLNGGIIKAKNKIVSKKLGSNNIPTEIVLGFTEQDKQKLKEVTRKLDKLNENLIKFSAIFQQCNTVFKQLNLMEEIDQVKLAQTQQTYDEANLEVQELIAEIDVLRGEKQYLTNISKMTESPVLIASESVNPGVNITINNCKYQVKSVMGGKVFTVKNNRIKMTPYEEQPQEDLD